MVSTPQNKQAVEILSMITYKETHPADNLWMILEVESFLVCLGQHLHCSLVGESETENPANSFWIPESRKVWDDKCIQFYLPYFVLIYYILVDNYYKVPYSTILAS